MSRWQDNFGSSRVKRANTYDYDVWFAVDKHVWEQGAEELRHACEDSDPQDHGEGVTRDELFALVEEYEASPRVVQVRAYCNGECLTFGRDLDGTLTLRCSDEAAS